MTHGSCHVRVLLPLLSCKSRWLLLSWDAKASARTVTKTGFHDIQSLWYRAWSTTLSKINQKMMGSFHDFGQTSMTLGFPSCLLCPGGRVSFFSERVPRHLETLQTAHSLALLLEEQGLLEQVPYFRAGLPQGPWLTIPICLEKVVWRWPAFLGCGLGYWWRGFY